LGVSRFFDGIGVETSEPKLDLERIRGWKREVIAQLAKGLVTLGGKRNINAQRVGLSLRVETSQTSQENKAVNARLGRKYIEISCLKGELVMNPNGNPIIACSTARIVNSPESFETMQSIGPKVCIATAGAQGFLGFQSSVQTGVLPMAGRWGGGKIHMEEELNPIREIQYTMWESWQAHEKFHETKFEQFFELCGHCLSMVVEGPWEPVYEVLKGHMPPVRGMGQIAGLAADLQRGKNLVRFVTPQRSVAFAEHTVLPGHEEVFEKGAIDTMEALSDAPGFLGYMILKQIGVCAIGSFMFDAESMALAKQTLGANPPKNPKPQFSTPDMKPHPTEYVIHSEWEAVEMGRMGFGRTLVNSKIRKIHDEGVIAHLARGPYIVFFKPIMEEETWRPMIS